MLNLGYRLGGTILRGGAGTRPSLNLNFLSGTLDSRVTFTRASNATLVDSTGKLTYAPNNLIIRSEEFDNSTWAKDFITATANVATAPNGTTTADKSTPTAGADLTTILQGTTRIGATYTARVTLTYSVFAKEAEFDRIQLFFSEGTGTTNRAQVEYSLVDGSVVTAAAVAGTFTNPSSTSTYVGDGWYRFALTFTTGTAVSGRARLAVRDSGTTTGDGTSGILLWGAQVEQVTYQTTPGTYNRTVASAYHGPRFNYDPVTLAPLGLLIEEQRANLVLQSQNFTDAAWIPARATSTADVTTSPDGTTNADRITADGTSGNHNISQNVTYTAAAHTISVYAKKDTNNFVQLRFATAAIADGTGFANFDLNAGTVGTIGAGLSAASITPAGNGWYRCTITGTTLAVATNFAIYIVTNASAITAQSNTLATSIFLYGAQLEAGSFATSYIPNVDDPARTRAPDLTSMTGTNFSSWYNQSEGTIVWDAETLSTASVNGVVNINNSTSSSRIYGFYSTTSALGIVTVGGSEQVSFNSGTLSGGLSGKTAFAYALNNFAQSTRGSAVIPDSLATVPTVSQMNIGTSHANIQSLNGHIRTITYYPQRINNQELQILSVSDPSLNLNFLSGTLDSRVTFSRTTNATLVDSTGKVTYAPNNQVTHSEQFDNAAWTKTNSTIVANATADPNGAITADKHIPNAAATIGAGSTETRVFQSPSATIGVNYVYSMYAKAGEYDEVELAIITTPSASAVFSLTSGTVVSFSGTVASITSAGNGWYRCSITATASATGALAVRWSASSSTVSVGDGTSGIFVWGSQFEAVTYQTLPSTYVQTVASAYYGPRFDYDPVTLAPKGLLIEEQRANLLKHSEEFNNNTSWSKVRSSITANATTSPDGTTNADRFVIDTTVASNHSCGQSVSVTSGITYAFTVFAKADQFSQINLRFSARFPAGNAVYDLNSGTVDTNGTVVSASMTSFGNGWWRCVLVMTANATGASGPQIFLAQSSSITIATADNTSGLFIWGAQLEAGSFATSYILPTVDATVTRAVESAAITGTNFSSWYNASEGTIVFSGDSVRPTSIDPATRTFQFDDGTVNENIRSGGTATLQVVDDASDPPIINLIPSPAIPFNGTVFKFASAYKLNDFATVTTDAVATNTSGTIPTVTQLSLGGPSNSGVLNGHIRRFTYYPQRIDNAQLLSLTV